MRKRISLAVLLGLASMAWASNDESRPEVPSALIPKLNAWLDAKTEYRDRQTQPRILLIDAERAEDLHGVANRSGGRIRGLYDADTGTIYLTKPWSPDDLHDVSVLLHEMVHHRQAGKHWYCAQAQEWRAYQIQSQWLAERNIQDNFYWPAILLQSSCANRDIHPE